MLLDLGDGLRVRPWRRDDLDALLRHANNAKIAANLRDQFPHPYTRRDGIDYLNYVRAMDVPMSLAMELNGEAIGGIGFKLGVDIARLSVEMGYWLAESGIGDAGSPRARSSLHQTGPSTPTRWCASFPPPSPTMWHPCACWKKPASSGKAGFCAAERHSRTASCWIR